MPAAKIVPLPPVAASSREYPSAAQAWSAVLIFALAALLSYTDRQILALLVDPIRSDLHISDTGLSILQGAAFAVLYSLIGLPLGRIADLVPRRTLLLFAVLLWSLGTVLCGCAQSFAQLFTARLLVGVGEAALAPAAMSLIGDYFRPSARALPTGVFLTGMVAGGGTAIAVGGYLLSAAEHAAFSVLPIMRALAPWRQVLVILGSSGAMVALLFLALREPPGRRIAPADIRARLLELTEVFDVFRSRYRLLLPLYAAMGIGSIVDYAILSWTPRPLVPPLRAAARRNRTGAWRCGRGGRADRHAGRRTARRLGGKALWPAGAHPPLRRNPRDRPVGRAGRHPRFACRHCGERLRLDPDFLNGRHHRHRNHARSPAAREPRARHLDHRLLQHHPWSWTGPDFGGARHRPSLRDAGCRRPCAQHRGRTRNPPHLRSLPCRGLGGTARSGGGRLIDMATQSFDILVIGAGIAGASVAAELARTHRVAILEREEMPGYHSTGRSAALFSEIYGNTVVRALSRASRDFFYAPPPGFSPSPLVRPRGALYVAREVQIERLERFAANEDVAGAIRRVSRDEALRACPILRPGHVAAALLEDDAADVDVDALHQGYLRQFRARDGTLVISADVRSLIRDGTVWTIEAAGRAFKAPVVVNAAGAWADTIASLAGAAPLCVQPCRRTAVLVDPPPGLSTETWPMVIDIEESFYLKPDAGLLLISPADESPVEPCDVQPEELDVAVAIDRVEQATTLKITRVRRRWAGLRSFAPDRSPVIGFDAKQPGFFWLAGQGGYGIQTAPAASRFAAALLRGEAPPRQAVDIDPSQLSPARFTRA